MFNRQRLNQVEDKIAQIMETRVPTWGAYLGIQQDAILHHTNDDNVFRTVSFIE